MTPTKKEIRAIAKKHDIIINGFGSSYPGHKWITYFSYKEDIPEHGAEYDWFQSIETAEDYFSFYQKKFRIIYLERAIKTFVEFEHYNTAQTLQNELNNIN